MKLLCKLGELSGVQYAGDDRVSRRINWIRTILSLINEFSRRWNAALNVTSTPEGESTASLSGWF